MTVREEVARAIYEAAFDPYAEDEAVRKRQKPSPGWSWERTSQEMREYALRQADFALEVVKRRRSEIA